MTILITGGTGWVGTGLAHRLVERGEDLILFDIAPQIERVADIKNNIKVVQGDQAVWPEVLNVFKENNVEGIFHLGMISLPDANCWAVYEKNVAGIMNVLEAARLFGVKRVVFTSTMSTYNQGIPTETITDETLQRPNNVYGVSKLCGELLGRFYRKKFDLDFRCIRYPQITGPSVKVNRFPSDLAKKGQYIGWTIQSAALGRSAEFPVSEDNKLPVLYYEDALRATIMLYDAPKEQIETVCYNVVGVFPSLTAREVELTIKGCVPLNLRGMSPWRGQLMYSPAEILHGLIDPQTIVPTLLGAKAVVFDFQSSQDSHAAFGQRIAPDPVLSQVLGHPFEMGLQEPEDFLKGLRMALIPRHLFQAVQRRAGLLFVLTVFEDVPDTTQEGAQATDLLIGLDDLDQALLFFGTHSLFGLEQHIAVLPQALGQGLEFLLVPWRGHFLAPIFDPPPPRHSPLPQMSPDVLQNVKVVILDRHLRSEDRANGVVVGFATIDVEGLQVQTQVLHLLQEPDHGLLVALIYLLGGHQAAMLIFEDQDTARGTPGENFIEMGLGDRLVLIESLDHLLTRGQLAGDLFDPAMQGRFRGLDMEKLAQQPSRPPIPHAGNDDQQGRGAHHHLRDPAMGIQTPGARSEMHPLALLEVVAITGDHSVTNRPGQSTQLLDLEPMLGPPMEPRLGAQPQALMDILTTGIDCDHQNPVFISPTEGTVGIGFNDFGANRDGDK